MDLQEHVLIYVPKTHLCGASEANARKVLVQDFSKDIFLEAQHETNVVNYDAYFDILLVGSMYVTTFVFFKDTTNPRHRVNPATQA